LVVAKRLRWILAVYIDGALDAAVAPEVAHRGRSARAVSSCQTLNAGGCLGVALGSGSAALCIGRTADKAGVVAEITEFAGAAFRAAGTFHAAEVDQVAARCSSWAVGGLGAGDAAFGLRLANGASGWAVGCC
jgi:hypothetical protein